MLQYYLMRLNTLELLYTSDELPHVHFSLELENSREQIYPLGFLEKL